MEQSVEASKILVSFNEHRRDAKRTRGAQLKETKILGDGNTLGHYLTAKQSALSTNKLTIIFEWECTHPTAGSS